jgi:hypothetical protein
MAMIVNRDRAKVQDSGRDQDIPGRDALNDDQAIVPDPAAGDDALLHR